MSTSIQTLSVKPSFTLVGIMSGELREVVIYEFILFYFVCISEAKNRWKTFLPWWEIDEIAYYPRVWYVGENASKKVILNQTNPNNYGFDNLRKHDGAILKIVS